jgi:predicted NAD/FAD-dependent oxidoreductase
VSAASATPLRRIALVGAGLAGLTAARAISDAGCSVTVFEKSRAPGGRAATRRDGAVQFDHGAQYFTQRDPRVAPLVAAWAARGLVAPWPARLVAWSPDGTRAVATDEPRWVAVPAMRALGVHLSGTLPDVRLGATVRALVPHAHGWHVACDEAPSDGPFDVVLVTTPAPQAEALLAPHGPAFAERLGTEMLPCIAAMCVLTAPAPVAWDGAFVNGHPVLSWVARDASKPGRPDAECWVLHATSAWSAAHLEQEPASLLPALLAAFADVLGAPVAPVRAIAHRWRYALPAPATRDEAGASRRIAHDPREGGRDDALYDAVRGLGAGGDWCVGGRLEGAIRSGLALADRVLAERVRTAGVLAPPAVMTDPDAPPRD